MKTFGQFVETTTPLLNISQFPIIAATRDGSTRLPKMIATMNAAFNDGMIQNARFVDLKSHFSNLLSNIRQESYHDMSGDLRQMMLWAYNQNVSFDQANHAPGKLKLVQKFLAKDPKHGLALKFAAFTTEVATLHDAMEKLKGMSVKRVPDPNKETAANYIAPMASRAAGQLVIKTLTELTEQIKDDYIIAVAKGTTAMIENMFSLRNDEKMLRKFMMSNPQTYTFLHRVFVTDRQGVPVEMEKDWKDYVQKEAERAGDFMQQEFLYKNSKKLSKIVELKDNLTKCYLIGRATVMAQGIGGEMAFEFADGSNFKVRNSVKWNVSSAGTRFNQFPTTFHDVIMPNGKPMPTPSEQRMIEVFAVAKA